MATGLAQARAVDDTAVSVPASTSFFQSPVSLEIVGGNLAWEEDAGQQSRPRNKKALAADYRRLPKERSERQFVL